MCEPVYSYSLLEFSLVLLYILYFWQAHTHAQCVSEWLQLEPRPRGIWREGFALLCVLCILNSESVGRTLETNVISSLSLLPLLAAPLNERSLLVGSPRVSVRHAASSVQTVRVPSPPVADDDGNSDSGSATKPRVRTRAPFCVFIDL